MIITRIRGGLGNQLFQYAYGKYLATTNEQDLKCDVSWFTLNKFLKVSTVAEFQLDKLSISKLKTTRTAEILKNELIRLTGNKWKLLGKTTVLRENFEKCDRHNSNAIETEHIYLDGYWQSYHYLESIRDILLSEFAPLSNSREKVDRIYGELKGLNLIAVHFRRGDYLSKKKSRSLYVECSKEYYYTAMRKLADATSNPSFLVFSDDIDWVMRNIAYDYPAIFVEKRWHLTSVETLRLMSLCNHFIISNSTFSWWGAWLSGNKDKTVVSPRRWYKDNEDVSNRLLPGSWTVLEN